MGIRGITKKVGGRTFHWVGNYHGKREAQKRAIAIRQRGFPARVIDVGRGMYAVYSSAAYLAST